MTHALHGITGVTENSTRTELPLAAIRPQRKVSWLLLIPLAASILAGWIGYRSWVMRGVPVTVMLDQGHGLEPGADVRYNGIAVGEVRSVELSPDAEGVVVRAALRQQARHLARAGARFWVVRPQLGVTGFAGLETVVGPRYLAMLPGDGPLRRHFLGLSDPPIVGFVEPGDLEIVLQAPRRGGLRPGAVVTYRQVPVGTVLSVGLASDASAVEARVHVRKAYTQLIRERTRFWNVGGFEARLGIKGLSLQMESVESLLGGGVALATPPDAGEVVHTGHRFSLYAKPKSDWLQWQPVLVLGSTFLPPGSPLPAPMRAVSSWQEGRWLKSLNSLRGWVLQLENGLLGPADLLHHGQDRSEESSGVEVAGRPLVLTEAPVWSADGLALIDAHVTRLAWPNALQRLANEPEDCIAIGDASATPLPLAAARLKRNGRSWRIDPIVSIDPNWHGAAVLSRSDGKLIGLLLIERDIARVALLPQDPEAARTRPGGM